jgi:hypothetical protein
MANRGNIGKCLAVPRVISYSRSFFGEGNRTVNTDMTGTSSVPGSIVLLSRNGVQIDRTHSNASTGVWHFYSAEDSGSLVYTVVTVTQSGPTGEAWIASVAAGVATVSKIASSIRANGSVSSG